MPQQRNTPSTDQWRTSKISEMVFRPWQKVERTTYLRREGKGRAGLINDLK